MCSVVDFFHPCSLSSILMTCFAMALCLEFQVIEVAVFEMPMRIFSLSSTLWILGSWLATLVILPITGVKILISQKGLGSSSSRKGGSRLQIISEARPLSRNVARRVLAAAAAEEEDRGSRSFQR